jgi:hypothetical protein
MNEFVLYTVADSDYVGTVAFHICGDQLLDVLILWNLFGLNDATGAIYPVRCLHNWEVVT